MSIFQEKEREANQQKVKKMPCTLTTLWLKHFVFLNYTAEIKSGEIRKIMALVRASAVLMERCSSAGAPANQLFNSANF